VIIADGPEAYGDTIFCDDIRAEIGGKLTFVGMYTTVMFVYGTFPFVIPKFALRIVYRQRHDSIILPIKFWIFVPGDSDEKPSIELVIPDEAAQQTIDNVMKMAATAQETMQHPYATIFSQMILSPFLIREPGMLKVRAVRGDRLIRLGALLIKAADQAQVPIGMGEDLAGLRKTVG
jgi:hypothetical protein